MSVSEKSHQNVSSYIQFFSKKDLNLIKKGIISSEKMRNSGNYNYDYYIHIHFCTKYDTFKLVNNIQIMSI